MYSLYRYIGPKVYTIWVHGPLGYEIKGNLLGSVELTSVLRLFDASELKAGYSVSGFVGV